MSGYEVNDFHRSVGSIPLEESDVGTDAAYANPPQHARPSGARSVGPTPTQNTAYASNVNSGTPRGQQLSSQSNNDGVQWHDSDVTASGSPRVGTLGGLSGASSSPGGNVNRIYAPSNRAAYKSSRAPDRYSPPAPAQGEAGYGAPSSGLASGIGSGYGAGSMYDQQQQMPSSSGYGYQPQQQYQQPGVGSYGGSSLADRELAAGESNPSYRYEQDAAQRPTYASQHHGIGSGAAGLGAGGAAAALAEHEREKHNAASVSRNSYDNNDVTTPGANRSAVTGSVVPATAAAAPLGTNASGVSSPAAVQHGQHHSSVPAALAGAAGGSALASHHAHKVDAERNAAAAGTTADTTNAHLSRASLRHPEHKADSEVVAVGNKDVTTGGKPGLPVGTGTAAGTGVGSGVGTGVAAGTAAGLGAAALAHHNNKSAYGTSAYGTPAVVGTGVVPVGTGAASSGVGLHADEAHNSSLLAGSQRIAAFLAEVFAIASVALVLVWALAYRNGFHGLNMEVHAFVGVLGMVFFVTQVVLAYRILPFHRLGKDIITSVNYVLAVACIAVAFAAVYAGSTTNDPHLRTLHSWLSLGTSGLFLLQFVSAIFHFFAPVRDYAYRGALVPYLSFLTLATFSLGLLTTITGIQEWQTLLASGYGNQYAEQMGVGNSGTSGASQVGGQGGASQVGAGQGTNFVGLKSSEFIIANVLGGCLWALLLTTLYASMPTQVPVAAQAGAVPLATGAYQRNAAYNNGGDYYNRRASLTDKEYGAYGHADPMRKSSISARDPTKTDRVERDSEIAEAV